MRNHLHLIVGSAATVLWLCAPTQAADAVTDDPPGRVARLSYVRGEVSLLPAGGDNNDWTEATLNRPLTSGDKLALDPAARAELQLGSADVHLDGDANFAFLELTDTVLQASLTAGAAHINVRELNDGDIVEIDTPHSAVVIKRPGEYRIAILEGGATTLVKTYSGAAEVTDSRSTLQVQAKEQALIGTDAAATVAQIDPRNAFDAWAHDRNRRYEKSATSRYVASNVIGYEDLDDHGEWTRDPAYGHVWYPSHVAADWSPYRHGHWSWISPWGWTWVDQAPWGFAPFHYGRWAYLHSRWCWVPGPIHTRAVYAPALVAWVGATPGFSVSISFGGGIGWFPLAPHEVYVPGYRYSRHHLHHVNHANTVFVNNVYINRVYTHGNSYVAHANRHIRNAVTVVERDAFVSARPVREHMVRADERNWRVSNTPPTLPPKRESRDGPDHRSGSSRSPQRWQDRDVVARNTPRPHAAFDHEQRERSGRGPQVGQQSPTQEFRGEPRRRTHDEPTRERTESPRFESRGRAPEPRAMPSLERTERSNRPAYEPPRREAPSRSEPAMRREERAPPRNSPPTDRQQEPRRSDRSHGRQER